MRCLTRAKWLGVSLSEAALSALQRLSALLGAEATEQLWNDAALDTHPVWAEARVLAREALTLLPDGN